MFRRLRRASCNLQIIQQMCVSHPSSYTAVVIATPQSRDKHHIYFTPEPDEPSGQLSLHMPYLIVLSRFKLRMA